MASQGAGGGHPCPGVRDIRDGAGPAQPAQSLLRIKAAAAQVVDLDWNEKNGIFGAHFRGSITNGNSNSRVQVNFSVRKSAVVSVSPS